MERYKFTVEIEVEVEAFDRTDAVEAIEDVFGIGHELAVDVLDIRILDGIDY